LEFHIYFVGGEFLGDIKIPAKSGRIFHDKASDKWLTENKWKAKIRDRFGFGMSKIAPVVTMQSGRRVPFEQFFYSLDKKSFILFFKTHFGPDPPGWDSLMSAQGYQISHPSIGNYTIINGIVRHGQPMERINDLDDVIEELKGDDIMLLIEHNNIPTAFLGQIDDYPDLLDIIQHGFLEG